MCSNFGGSGVVPRGYEGNSSINFMSEKLCSTDAVEMGIDKHMVVSYVDWGTML